MMSAAIACSSIMPYKDQNLDYLYSIQKDPSAFKGAVVAFNGDVAGLRETDRTLRLILRIDTPLYYYATGKGNSLSYEFLYVIFPKPKPRATKIAKGNKVKVLARVDGYETRQDGYGNTAGVVRVRAIALADRSQDKDFFLSDAVSLALYHSWKEGKLFFEESAEEVVSRVPPEIAAPVSAAQAPKPQVPAQPVVSKPAPAAGIVFDPEEPPFILDPAAQQAASSAHQEAPSSSALPENLPQASTLPAVTEDPLPPDTPSINPVLAEDTTAPATLPAPVK